MDTLDNVKSGMMDGDSPLGETDFQAEYARKKLHLKESKRESSWPSVLFLIHIHALGAYGLLLVLLHAKILTILFTVLLTSLGVLGVTCGSHRLWAHNSYRASGALRTFLMLCQTLVGQGSIYDWVLLHRLHHAKFETEDDPYYSNGTFLDAHIIANFVTLSDNQKKMMAEINMDDVKRDQVVMFQKKFYWLLYIIVFVILPLNAPMEYWGESFVCSLFVVGLLRYLCVIHMAWLVNSAKHVWGLRANETAQADSNMIFIITKSYWPSYHYVLPWDYQSGEFGTYGTGALTSFIRVWAAFGWAHGLKTMETSSVKEALTMAVETGRPMDVCLREVGEASLENLHPDHYLEPIKYTS